MACLEAVQHLSNKAVDEQGSLLYTRSLKDTDSCSLTERNLKESMTEPVKILRWLMEVDHGDMLRQAVNYN